MLEVISYLLAGMSSGDSNLDEIVKYFPFLRPAMVATVTFLEMEHTNPQEAIRSGSCAVQSFLAHFCDIDDEWTRSIIESHISFLLGRVETLQVSLQQSRYNSSSNGLISLSTKQGETQLPPSYEEAMGILEEAPPPYQEEENESPNGRFSSTLHQSIAPLLLKSNPWKFSPRKLLDEVEEVCSMIGVGIKHAVQKYAHCSLLHQELDQDGLCAHHEYRFTENGMYDPIFGVTQEAKQNFTVLDFAPLQFREIRKCYGISCSNYIETLCGPTDDDTMVHSLESMIPEGKSSASFLISKNKRIIIKSMSIDEFEFFQSILVDYYQFMIKESNTLLSRFFGLFQLQVEQNCQSYVIMDNFIPPLPDITRFDLKGSTLGRVATQEQRENGGILKDLDFSSFVIGGEAKTKFWNQLEIDCWFLENHSIMDYSLLVGVRYLKKGEEHMCTIAEGEKMRSYFNKPSGSFQGSYDDGSAYPIDYYIGIIDILQPFNIRKKVESAFKRIQSSQQQISCVDPITYSLRFRAFLQSKTSSLMPEKKMEFTPDFSSSNPFDFLAPVI